MELDKIIENNDIISKDEDENKKKFIIFLNEKIKYLLSNLDHRDTLNTVITNRINTFKKEYNIKKKYKITESNIITSIITSIITQNINRIYFHWKLSNDDNYYINNKEFLEIKNKKTEDITKKNIKEQKTKIEKHKQNILQLKYKDDKKETLETITRLQTERANYKEDLKLMLNNKDPKIKKIISNNVDATITPIINNQFMQLMNTLIIRYSLLQIIAQDWVETKWKKSCIGKNNCIESDNIIVNQIYTDFINKLMKTAIKTNDSKFKKVYPKIYQKLIDNMNNVIQVKMNETTNTTYYLGTIKSEIELNIESMKDDSGPNNIYIYNIKKDNMYIYYIPGYRKKQIEGNYVSIPTNNFFFPLTPKQKYLKYKAKYMLLKKQFEGRYKVYYKE